MNYKFLYIKKCCNFMVLKPYKIPDNNRYDHRGQSYSITLYADDLALLICNSASFLCNDGKIHTINHHEARIPPCFNPVRKLNESINRFMV